MCKIVLGTNLTDMAKNSNVSGVHNTEMASSSQNGSQKRTVSALVERARKSSVLTDGWLTLNDRKDFDKFGEMSDTEKRLYRFLEKRTLPSKTMFSIYQKEDNIVIAISTSAWHFGKNRFYVKRDSANALATITPKRVFCSGENLAQAINIVCHVLDVDDILPNTKTTLRRLVTEGVECVKDLITDSEDTAYKCSQLGLPYSSLQMVTTDIDAIVDRLWNNYSDELKDLLIQALILNKTINHKWSDRRINDEHTKWTFEIMKMKAPYCSDELVWKDVEVKLPDNITLINSEQACCAEGILMWHCLYTNYWGAIRLKKYVAFHVIDPDEGDYTVGFRILSNNTVELDQVRRKRNRDVSDKQHETAMHLQPIVEMMLDFDDTNEDGFMDDLFGPRNI
jgi:hypothetical protein